MGTTARRRKDGSIGYMARVRVIKDGVTYHETETFDRRPAAAAWISKRERELSKPGAVAKSKDDDPTTLAKVIDRYVEETVKEIGRARAKVLTAIKNYNITKMPCSSTNRKTSLNLEELFRERGFEVDQSTIHRWVLAYAPVIEKRLRQFRRRHCSSVRIDEPFVKIRDKGRYL